MKKLIIIIMALVLTTTIVIGGIGIINRNKDITLTKAEKTALESVNLGEYTVKDFDKGNDLKERCLKKDGAINTCREFDTYWWDCKEWNMVEDEEGKPKEGRDCLDLQKEYFTDKEMLEIMDAWEKSRMEAIADATIQRQNEAAKEQTKEGTTTIKEKK